VQAKRAIADKADVPLDSSSSSGFSSFLASSFGLSDVDEVGEESACARSPMPPRRRTELMGGQVGLALRDIPAAGSAALGAGLGLGSSFLGAGVGAGFGFSAWTTPRWKERGPLESAAGTMRH
jgi:hypothetical protein